MCLNIVKDLSRLRFAAHLYIFSSPLRFSMSNLQHHSIHTATSSPPRNKKDKLEDALYHVWKKTKPLFRSSEMSKAERSLPSLSTTLRTETSPHHHSTTQPDNFSHSHLDGHLSNQFLPTLPSHVSIIPPVLSMPQDTRSSISSISIQPPILPIHHVSQAFRLPLPSKEASPLFSGVS